MSVARGRALGLLAGLGADAVLGDPPNRWHPTAWFGTWAGWLERRCYADSVAAGVGFVVAAVAPVTLVGVGVEALGRRRPWLRPGCTALATWAVVGAVDSTRASPMGCTSIHQQISTAVKNDLPLAWQAATIVS